MFHKKSVIDYLLLSIKYERKNAIAYIQGKKIRAWFYDKMRDYYSKKHDKIFMRS